MTLLAQIADPPPNTLGTGLGIAAVVLVAGWAVIHWQRDRLRFGLMRAALENGVTRFPGIPPYWLVSLRQGVTLVALGIGLCSIGTAAWWLAREKTGTTTVTEAESPPQQRPPVSSEQPPAEAHGGRLDPHPPRDDREDQGPGGRPAPPPRGPGDADHRRPQFPPEDPLGLEPGHHSVPFQGEGPARPSRGDPAEPPHPRRGDNGARRAAEKRDDQRTIGMASVGAGLILLLLGVVRIGFSGVERRFAETEGSSIY